jgi:hypothetical protein
MASIAMGPKKEKLSCETASYDRPKDFTIFNHLPKHAIRIDILHYIAKDNKMSPATPLVGLIAPLRVGGLARDKVLGELTENSIFRIYMSNPDGSNEKHYADYLLDTAANERIKNLHVGMITSRYIGTQTDSLRLTTTESNATMGSAWLKIHNLTELPLTINDITIEPHTTYRYLGQFNQGVALGTILHNNDGLYQDFLYTKPNTDIYYGLVSDLNQPLEGCFQLEFNDDCEYGQTLWPFQEGVM